MDYDFFVWYRRTPVYYRCSKIAPDLFEVELYTYSKERLPGVYMADRIRFCRGVPWTSEPRLDTELFSDIVARIKAWEKEREGPLLSKE